MSRGCIPPIVLLVSALAGWGIFLGTQLPDGFPVATFICSVLGGLATTVFGVIVFQSTSLRGGWRASRRARRGLPPEPGDSAQASGFRRPTGCSALLPFALLIFQVLLALLAVTPGGQELFRDIASTRPTTRRF